jgi:hypothetical protein
MARPTCPRLATLLLLGLGAASCARLARCEVDRVRAEVLDYDAQMKPLRPAERELHRRMDELEGKIFTNQKAGVDLLSAVLVQATVEFSRRLAGVRVRSHLIRPHHQKKIHAFQELALAYEQLMRAYPKADFDAIRAGLKRRAQATRELEAADLRLTRLLRKYQHRRR